MEFSNIYRINRELYVFSAAEAEAGGSWNRSQPA